MIPHRVPEEPSASVIFKWDKSEKQSELAWQHVGSGEICLWEVCNGFGPGASPSPSVLTGTPNLDEKSGNTVAGLLHKGKALAVD